MFTGIVEDVGSIRSVTVRNRSSVLEIETGLSDIKISDSICISGICLTVVQGSPCCLHG
jgi:riboflavin synthase